MINGYSIFNGVKYFSEENGSQNYSVFQSIFNYLKPITNNGVKAWKSRGLLDESIKPSAKWDNSLNPGLDNIDISKF